jgi:hypothetical protein
MISKLVLAAGRSRACYLAVAIEKEAANAENEQKADRHCHNDASNGAQIVAHSSIKPRQSGIGGRCECGRRGRRRTLGQCRRCSSGRRSKRTTLDGSVSKENDKPSKMSTVVVDPPLVVVIVFVVVVTDGAVVEVELEDIAVVVMVVVDVEEPGDGVETIVVVVIVVVDAVVVVVIVVVGDTIDNDIYI